MIFLEFTIVAWPFPEAKHYFIGINLVTILADTSGGTKFGGIEFISYRKISLEEARTLGVHNLTNGIRAVLEQDCPSFKLDSPWAY